MLERIHKLVKRNTTPPQTVIDLLKNTLIGTNGTLYQLLDTEQKIYDLHQATFIYLERNEKAIANFTICKREIRVGEKKVPSLYIRYFAFDSLFQGGNQKSQGNSGFHQYFKAFFETSNGDPVLPAHEKIMYWAFIDPENLRSFNMNEQFGFQTIGTFKTTAFSRVNPKHKAVERAQEVDQKNILAALDHFYKDYQLYSPIHLFEHDNYFVIRKNGEIVCGIQANPVHWRIKSLPGFSGKLLLKFAPHIPRIKKLINPNNHRFLATEGLFWKPGHENEVANLLEGVLAETGHHSLLIWSDSEHDFLAKLPIKWGFIQRMKKNNKVHIVAKLNGYSEDEISSLRKRPKYLNGFDMT
ncbi:MAG: hypothetical protein GQ574_17650 [Crocinitomix sp.]|nr:hypothetical protein [Crocinitomix sp.]